MGASLYCDLSKAVITSAGSTRKLVEGIARLSVVLLLMIALGVLFDLALGLPRLTAPDQVPIGVGLIALALYLESRATFVLWTLGAGTPNPADPPKRLVTEGPYRFSRNPLYVARLLLLWGSALYLGSLGVFLISLILILALHFVLVPREELRLEKRFGGSYVEYRIRVPRWIAIRSRSLSRRDN